MIIHCSGHRILVDPCLSPKGSLPPYSFIRKKPRRNPTVDLPLNAESMLSQITAGMVTHCRFGHFDHLDGAGVRLLVQKKVPVYCNVLDEPFLQRRRICTVPLKMNEQSEFLTGEITMFPAAHGRGLAGWFMRPGAGYLIEPVGEKSIYISGDTVMTPTVMYVLKDLQPDIAVLNAGTATLDFGKPILMSMEEQLEFIKAAPGKVIAVHLDCLNHLSTTRDMLKHAVSKAGLSDKVMIPSDGEEMEL
ncbi:MAG: MBL fold metallo-hydrolase [Desulfobacterium sp.]|nr:MBL fold metallo-hydrolase [Desulfobacterium sp.]